MSNFKPFTPISSLRGAGDMSIGINQFDAIAAQMHTAYPQASDRIATAEQMVDDGVVEPAIGALILKTIEADTPIR